jgi:hypothetical protein
MSIHQKRLKLIEQHLESHEAMAFYLQIPEELVEIHYSFYFNPIGAHGLTEHQLSQLEEG